MRGGSADSAATASSAARRNVADWRMVLSDQKLGGFHFDNIWNVCGTSRAITLLPKLATSGASAPRDPLLVIGRDSFDIRCEPIQIADGEREPELNGLRSFHCVAQRTLSDGVHEALVCNRDARPPFAARVVRRQLQNFPHCLQ